MGDLLTKYLLEFDDVPVVLTLLSHDICLNDFSRSLEDSLVLQDHC